MRYSCINTILPYLQARWGLTVIVAVIYSFTSADIFADLNTYLVSFYLLMLTLNYFLPKGISQDSDDSLDDQSQPFSFNESSLNTFQPLSQLQHSSDKPLVRQMSEIQIWQRSTYAITLGMICSYFKMFQIDVFWPLLLVYFFGLAVYTVLKVLRTMKRYGYDLSDFKKQPQ